MKQYNFKLNCGDSVMNGVKVSAKANSEREARIKVVEAILTATRDLKLESLELLGTGRMTAAQLMGAAGGKKSKRVITPEDQRKMQEAVMKIGVPTHFRPSNDNVSACGIEHPRFAAYDGRDVDCLRCRGSKVWKRYMGISSLKK